MDGQELITVNTHRTDIDALGKPLVRAAGKTDLASTPTVADARRTRERQPDVAVHLSSEPASGRPTRAYGSYYAKYNVDTAARRVSIQIIDMESDQVVMEIPPEQVLKMARELQGYLDEGNGRIARTQASGG